MIRVTEVLAIHEMALERFGGAKGVRDNAGFGGGNIPTISNV
jgi:hypothetical protein